MIDKRAARLPSICSFVLFAIIVYVPLLSTFLSIPYSKKSVFATGDALFFALSCAPFFAIFPYFFAVLSSISVYFARNPGGVLHGTPVGIARNPGGDCTEPRWG